MPGRLNTPQLLFPFVFFVLLFAVESLSPLRPFTRPRIRRVILNFVFSLISAAVGMLVVRLAGIGTAKWATGHEFGLLNALGISGPASLIVGFLLMDLSFYYWHRANHAVAFLWRFHNVHHTDPDLDVSTAFRFHFVEILYSSLFRVIQVSVIGVSVQLYIVYELFFTLETMFHHSDVRLPIQIERLMNKIIVTPRMHGLHHSFYRTETNSNYGVIFSVWDRIHRSLRLNVAQSAVQIGVPAYQNSQDNSFSSLIVMPFKAQRKYWESGEAKYYKREYEGIETSRSLLME